MSKLVYTDARIFTAGADLTGVSNKVEISAEREAKETTNFLSAGYKEFIAGLGSATVNAEGFWEALDLTKVDDATYAQLGAIGPWTVTPATPNVGQVAYLVNALETTIAPFGGGVGDVATYKTTAMSTWPLARGQVANAPGTAVTTTGTGTGIQLPAVAADQALYASLHVLSVAGTTPSATFAIESAAANTFVGPTTRLTFTAATTLGGQIIRTSAGAITDTWYRAKWTISGTTPSFLAIVAIGIA